MSSLQRVTDEEIDDMRAEARRNLREPRSSDNVIATYDYPAEVPSRDLLSALNELVRLRKVVARRARKAKQ